jgi:hypothetical protein
LPEAKERARLRDEIDDGPIDRHGEPRSGRNGAAAAKQPERQKQEIEEQTEQPKDDHRERHLTALRCTVMLAARRTALFSLALLLACNSIVGFGDLEKVKADGGVATDDDDFTDDDDHPNQPDSSHDAPVSAPRCDPKKPFGPPSVLTELDGSAETKRAIMTRDELEIFYLRGSSAPYELRHATRAKRTDAWGEPATEVLSPSASELGSIVLDGLKLYYWNVDTSGSTLTTAAVYATRPKTGAGGFSPGTKLAGVDRAVTGAENDDAIYWAINEVIDGAGNELVHRGNLQGATVVGDSTLTDVHFFPSLDDHPVVAASDLVLYFASTRADDNLGAGDIWRATRASKAQPFASPVNVKELNSTTVDTPSWVSDDDCVILLDRSRHINIAQRPL